jgi:lysophospholipase L1-like esterase
MANLFSSPASATVPPEDAARPSAPRRSRCSITSWPGKLLLLLSSLGLVLLLAELGLRAYDRWVCGLPFWWDPATSARTRTELCNPFLLFRGPNQDWKTRGKTPEQVIEASGRHLVRIVCIGGSTTQDVTAFMEERTTYPSELQRLLNEALGPSSDVVVETINAGFAAHSSLHSLVLLETEILDLHPDLLIVYHNINDLMVNYFPGSTSPAYANAFLNPYFLPPELTAERSTIWDHSRLYAWGRDGMRRVLWYRVQYTDEPVELRHAEVFRTNLRNLCAVAHANGIRTMFGEQAMAADQELFERQFRTKKFNAKVKYPRLEPFCQHFARYNEMVREVAAEHQVPCASPYTVLKNRPELFADLVHLHAQGARLVGQEFARVLTESGLLAQLIETRRRQASAARAP